MSLTLTPVVREKLEEALVEVIAEGGTFSRGSALYLATLHTTPTGTELEGHELEDVLEMWPSLADELRAL